MFSYPTNKWKALSGDAPALNRTRILRTVSGQLLTPDRIKEDKIAKTDNELFFKGYSYGERRIAEIRRSIQLLGGEFYPTHPHTQKMNGV